MTTSVHTFPKRINKVYIIIIIIIIMVCALKYVPQNLCTKTENAARKILGLSRKKWMVPVVNNGYKKTTQFCFEGLF